MASAKRYRRKYKFIDRKQQTRFAVVLGLYALMFPILFLTLTMIPPLTQGFVGDREKIIPLIYLVGFAVQHWWVVLLALGFVAFVSVLFSHQIFGPMRRFEIALEQKKENPNQPVNCHVREGDYFHDFSELLEEVLNQSAAPQASSGPEERQQTPEDTVVNRDVPSD